VRASLRELYSNEGHELKVAIVGGGISGLAAAYDLQAAGGFEVTIFEQSPVIGGKLQTLHQGQYLIEQGPDSIFSVKPWAVELMCELGMEDELLEPLGNEFSMLVEGKLHTVPRPLAALNVGAAGALEKADFLTEGGSTRALQEANIPPGDGLNESVASFFRRRFGIEFSKLIVEPLLAGTHGGDPAKLSMEALYPAYLAMERVEGSISRGVAARAGRSSHGGAFRTLAGGMAGFPKRLAAALTTVDIKLSARISSLTAVASGLSLETSSGQFEFDHVILATPANVSAGVLRAAAPEAAEILSAIRFVSTAIVTLAYPRDAFSVQLRGNGFLVPFDEPSGITGCTWSSNKWANRAPDDTLLLRAFIGRDDGLDIDSLDDDRLLTIATNTLSELLMPSKPPRFSRLDRWSKGLPQYELGHLTRLAEIENALVSLPISLIGSSYRGASIPDAVRQGREAAKRLIEG
jgi:oxygen-dependent protoporphyrinogen oxidase